MLLRTFKLLKLLLDFKIVPGMISQHYMVFFIYILNKYEVSSPIYNSAAEYTHAYINFSKMDIYFLKTWKRKILADRYYKEANLDSFIELDNEKKAIYRVLVNKLE
jgi:hypothetical protein